jgi:hypothetical protein
MNHTTTVAQARATKHRTAQAGLWDAETLVDVAAAGLVRRLQVTSDDCETVIAGPVADPRPARLAGQDLRPGPGADLGAPHRPRLTTPRGGAPMPQAPTHYPVSVERHRAGSSESAGGHPAGARSARSTGTHPCGRLMEGHDDHEVGSC